MALTDSLVQQVLESPDNGVWVRPTSLGLLSVVDMADGTFQVRFSIRQPGLYSLMIWALGNPALGMQFVDLAQVYVSVCVSVCLYSSVRGFSMFLCFCPCHLPMLKCVGAHICPC